jgi:cytochrome c-type biogenesis protein CcmH/NrfG
MRRSRRGRRLASQRMLTLVAVAMISALVLSGLITLLPLGGDEDAEPFSNQASIQVTPGQEVSRLETAIAEQPNDVRNIVVLAEVLANSGRLNESFPWFERAIAINPSDAQVRIAFGRALHRAGSWFDAELQYLRAAELEPDNVAAAFYLASLYEEMPQPRIDKAMTWYERAIEIDPDSVIAEQSRQRLEELNDLATPATPGS